PQLAGGARPGASLYVGKDIRIGAVPGPRVSKKMLRAFIAIQLSAELKRQIAELQAQLKREALESPGVGWMRPEAIHLTLKFLGETEEALVPKLRSVLEAAVSSVRPF